jgi:hypothetical protein
MHPLYKKADSDIYGKHGEKVSPQLSAAAIPSSLGLCFLWLPPSSCHVLSFLPFILPLEMRSCYVTQASFKLNPPSTSLVVCAMHRTSLLKIWCNSKHFPLFLHTAEL